MGRPVRGKRSFTFAGNLMAGLFNETPIDCVYLEKLVSFLQ